MELNDLKQFLDKIVILRMTDGEVAKVKVDFIDEEYQDIIVDVLWTSRPDRYRDTRLPALLLRQTSSLPRFRPSPAS